MIDQAIHYKLKRRHPLNEDSKLNRLKSNKQKFLTVPLYNMKLDQYPETKLSVFAQENNVAPSAFRVWIKNYNSYLLAPNKFTLHTGPKIEGVDMEPGIIAYITQRRADNLAVTTLNIATYIRSIKPDFKKERRGDVDC